MTPVAVAPNPSVYDPTNIHDIDMEKISRTSGHDPTHPITPNRAEQEANIIEHVIMQWNTQVKEYTERSEQESAAQLAAELVVALDAEHAKEDCRTQPAKHRKNSQQRAHNHPPPPLPRRRRWEQSLLETLLEALGKPTVQQRVRDIIGTNGVQKRKRKTKVVEIVLWPSPDVRNRGSSRTNKTSGGRASPCQETSSIMKECRKLYTNTAKMASWRLRGPTSKLYFGPGWANSLWNKKIFQHSIQRILQKRAEDPGHYDVPDVKEEYLMALFSNLLREARAEWSCHQLHTGETNEEARERAETYEMAEASELRKMHVCQETADRMLSISAAKQDGKGIETWAWLKDDLLAELDSGGNVV
ncbi:hypothetical protein B0H14DRAFT_2589701 [Mycena olivaceomarginata]|nr:hypothetical protein B0H14DRAFT_2589701 [Mycena olivaceomarginata]